MTFSSAKNEQYLLIITIILGFFVLFWGLGSLQLMSLNEGRRALAIKEMFTSSHWLLPTQNGELYLTKPPLLYWLSMAISLLVGQVNEWTLRLPSALSALSVACMVYFYTKKHAGALAALFAIQLLIANVAFAMLARRVEIEMLLTALCLGALLSAIQYVQENAKPPHWIYLSYALLGLAVLTKGPVAMLFVTLPLLAIAIYTKNQRVKAVLINKTGWLIFILIALSWYIAVTIKLGPDIWATIAKRDMLEKMQSDDTAKPLLSYLAWIATDFLLLIGLFLYQPKKLWLKHKTQLPFLMLVFACVLPLIIFSLFSNKHAKYLLPIYPVIIILLSIQMARIAENGSEKLKKWLLMLGVFLPFIFVLFYMFAEPKIFDYRVTAFSEFEQWSSALPVSQLYSLEPLDMRLIYYTKRPIKMLTAQQLEDLKKSGRDAIILSEDKNMNAITSQTSCQLKVFEPYLKQHKKLVAFGLGSLCIH